MSIKELVVGGVLTVFIGGTAYTVSQQDVVDNFANDTGLTQQEAEKYVENIDTEDLLSFDKIGAQHINSGNELKNVSAQIDCGYYEYTWETPTLSCQQGKAQLYKIGNDEIALGRSYKVLVTDEADRTDIKSTIGLIDVSNSNYSLEIIRVLISASEIDEGKKANSYNKATLQAVLQSQD